MYEDFEMRACALFVRAFCRQVGHVFSPKDKNDRLHVEHCLNSSISSKWYVSIARAESANNCIDEQDCPL